MKRQNVLIAFLFLVTLNLTAQKHELGKVTIDELKEKVYPLDTSAVAAVLFKKGDVHFEYSGDDGFEMQIKVSCKIKIYKKEGYDYANFARLYDISGNSKESLNFSNAYTYNLVNGKIEKTKLKSDGEFDEKINKYLNRKKITMPNVKEGSIIEFEYLLKSYKYGIIDEWEFQSSVPVKYSEFTTYIPEYFVYNAITKGFILPKTVKNAKARTINYTYIKNFEPGMNTANTATNRINSSLDFDEQIFTYSISDIPALKEEAFVNNIKNYTSSISHELSMTRYPGENPKSYSTDWESVTKTIYDSENFGSELSKTGYFEDDVETLLVGLTSQNEKIAVIFNFVKSKVKWNEYNSIYCNGGVKKAYKENTGNVAEINLMLTAMLRYAKIDANPVLISTRSNGIALFPNTTAYNYVIAAVEIENDLILLDATNKNALPNILPTRDLNWVGRMIRKDGTSASVDLMPKTLSNDFTNIIVSVANDGTIEGKIREQHFDYNAYLFRNNFGDASKESYLEYLEKKLNNTEVSDYDVTGKKELGEPVVENYSFKNNNSVEIIGDKMYFAPLFFFATTENLFKQEKREYPVDFVFPNKDRFIINITIPEGYTVESLPKSISIPMTDKLIDVKYQITTAGNKIQLSYTKDTNTSIVTSEYYEELKAIFNEIVKKETEKIVLKKL